MRTLLALLIAALFLLTTPLLAVAHGGDRHDGGNKHNKSWVKDRHDYGHYRQNQDDRWERRAKKHFKRHLREHRRDNRRVAHYPRQRYNRPHHINPDVVFGFPRIIFRIDL